MSDIISIETDYQRKIRIKREEAIENMVDNGETTETVSVSKASGRVEDSKHRIRTSVAKMKLTKDQEQASRDIDTAIDYREKGMGYAMLGVKSPNLLAARGGTFSDAKYEWVRKMVDRAHEWREETPPKFWQTVEVLNSGVTARQHSRVSGIHHSTIVEWYKAGLDSYAEMFYKSA